MGRFCLSIFFVVTSVVVIAAAAAVVNGTIGSLAERNLVRVSQENTVREAVHILEHLKSDKVGENPTTPGVLSLEALASPEGLPKRFSSLIVELNVAKLNLFDLEGKAVWSTDPGTIGKANDTNPLFQAAREGIVGSNLVRNEEILDVAGASRRVDIVETYAPVLDAPGGSVIGVIEICQDVPSHVALLVSSTKRTILLVTVGTMGTLFLVLVGFILAADAIIYRSHKRLLAQEVEAARLSEMQASRRRIVAAQESVRQQIAEELHGPIQTKLYAVWQKLGRVQNMIRNSPEVAEAGVERLMEELDNIRETDIREVSHRLHPGIIRAGLGAGIRSLRDSFEALVPIDLNIDQEVLALEKAGHSSIPGDVKLALYRVTEEALSNVVKHANASLITVNLWTSHGGKELCLSIKDNGCGFESGASKQNLGFVIIDDYVAALGGYCQMETAPGKGTKITATIPLSRTTPGSSGLSVDPAHLAKGAQV